MNTEMEVLKTLIDICKDKDIIIEFNAMGIILIKFSNDKGVFKRMYNKELICNEQIELVNIVEQFIDETNYKFKED